MSAQVANKNSVTHGLRSKRELTLPSLGKGFERCIEAANRLRRRQEARIRAQGGDVSEEQDRIIQRACLQELRCRAAAKYHREHPTLTVVEKMELVREMTKAATERDKILSRLGLDASDKPDPFAALRAQHAQANEVQP